MESVWYFALSSLGCGLGLHFGRFFASLFRRPDWPDAIYSHMKNVCVFLLISIGGAAILGLAAGGSRAAFYVLGLGVGFIISWIIPRFPAPYSPRELRQWIEINKLLPTSAENTEEQALLTVLPVVPPRLIQKSEEIGESELADRMGAALDSLGARIDRISLMLPCLPQPLQSVFSEVFFAENSFTNVAHKLGTAESEVARMFEDALLRIKVAERYLTASGMWDRIWELAPDQRNKLICEALNRVPLGLEE